MFGIGADKSRRPYTQQQAVPARNNDHRPVHPGVSPVPATAARPVLAPASSFRPQPKPVTRPESSYTRTEPTYHNLMSSRPAEGSYEERS